MWAEAKCDGQTNKQGLLYIDGTICKQSNIGYSNAELLPGLKCCSQSEPEFNNTEGKILIFTF